MPLSRNEFEFVRGGEFTSARSAQKRTYRRKKNSPGEG